MRSGFGILGLDFKKEEGREVTATGSMGVVMSALSSSLSFFSLKITQFYVDYDSNGNM